MARPARRPLEWPAVQHGRQPAGREFRPAAACWGQSCRRDSGHATGRVKPLDDCLGATLAGLAVPPLGRVGCHRAPCGQPLGISTIRSGRRPSSVLVPVVDRDRPLGVVAQREARRAEDRRLLLDPAGVGEHRGARCAGARGVEVVERLGDEAGGAPSSSSSRAPRGAARVRGCSGNTTGIVAATLASAADGRREHRGVVGQRRPVERDEHVAARWQPEPHRRARAGGPRAGGAAGCRPSCCRRTRSAPAGCPRRRGWRPRHGSA